MSLLHSMTLPELHDRFCAEASMLHELSDRTIQWYRYGFKNLQRYKAFSTLKELDELTLTEFLFWGKKTRDWKSKTLLGNYNSLSSFFAWCVRKNLIVKSPLENIPRPKLAQSLPKSLTKKQALQLFESVQMLAVPKTYSPRMFHKRRDIAIFAMFLFTGLRRQELINLKLDDVNFNEDIITVHAGKGNKDRIIPMSFELKRYLQHYIKEREVNEVLSPYFFTTVKYQGSLGVRTLTRLFERVKQASGIQFSAHQLRHTFATMMAQSKCDIYALSKMMGHSDIKTTTIYLSASTEHLKTQINNHPLNFA